MVVVVTKECMVVVDGVVSYVFVGSTNWFQGGQWLIVVVEVAAATKTEVVVMECNYNREGGKSGSS